ncbi:MAG: hypothetical protein AB8C84_05290 [Oligoflexales bacterium]
MKKQKFSNFLFFLAIIFLAQGCYFIEFFNGGSDSSSGGDEPSVSRQPVLGGTIGPVAGSVDEIALAAVYAIYPGTAPASIRPDPDLYVRRFLRQFREESSTLARAIGNVEGFRLLLGGASIDFQKMPQQTYDATSLLASLSVAGEVCEGLVSPNNWEHSGWETILPFGANDTQNNIKFLIQRITGQKSSEILAEDVDQLQQILDDHRENLDDPVTYEDYQPVCAVLSLDAEALLL